MLKRLLDRLRYRAIELLAGNRTIIINARMPGGELCVSGNGCYVSRSHITQEGEVPQ